MTHTSKNLKIVKFFDGKIGSTLVADLAYIIVITKMNFLKPVNQFY